MPQIWATYEELANHFGRTVPETRDAVIAAAWPRRQCSDGLTRVKLTPTLGDELTRAGDRTPAQDPRLAGEVARLQVELDQIRSVLSAALLDLAAERDRTASLSAELLRQVAQDAERFGTGHAASDTRRVA